MSNMLFIQIIIGITYIFFIIAGVYMLTFARHRLKKEKFESYSQIGQKIVEAMEQSLGEGKGADKKQEAVMALKQVTKEKLSDSYLDVLIESAVYKMNQGTDKES